MKFFLCFFTLIILIYIFQQFAINNSPVHIPNSYKYNQKSTTITSDNYTLLVWNIHKENHTIEFQKEFKSLLHMYKPDFIILQEYIYNQKFLPISNLNYIFAPNIYKSSINSFSGILNASKYISTSDIPILSTDTEPIFYTPKISLITKYNLTMINFNLINIHALNFNLNNQGFINQIQKTLKHLDTAKEAVIFAGDFNTWNKIKLMKLNSIMNNNNLKGLNLEHSKVKNFFGYSLDHIYYNKYINIINFKVIETKSSDHNAIILNFKIVNK